MNEPTNKEIIEFYYNVDEISQEESAIITVRHFLAKQEAQIKIHNESILNGETGDMLSFEEWWYYVCKLCACDSVNSIIPSDARTMYKLARQGMIALPPEPKWPKWASGYVTFFTRQHGYHCMYDGEEYDQYFPRTKPQPIKMTMAEALVELEKLKGGKVVIE